MDAAPQPQNPQAENPAPAAENADLSKAAPNTQIGPQLINDLRNALVDQFITALSAHFKTEDYKEAKNDILDKMENGLLAGLKQQFELSGNLKERSPGRAQVLRMMENQIVQTRREIYRGSHDTEMLRQELTGEYSPMWRGSNELAVLERKMLADIIDQEGESKLTTKDVDAFVVKSRAFFAIVDEHYKVIEHCAAVAAASGLDAALKPEVRYEAIRSVWPTAEAYLAAVEQLNQQALNYKLGWVDLLEASQGSPEHLTRATQTASEQIHALHRNLVARGDAEQIYGTKA